MLTIEFSLNLFMLGAIVIVSALVGFSIRSRQLVRSRLRVAALEKEMLSNYAEILELQRDYINMESQLKDFHIPVIPIKSKMKDIQEENSGIPDISLRKKLLSGENLFKQSVAK
jgi:hypothetical protein